MEFRFRNTFQNITRANLRFGGDLPLLSLFEDELYSDSFSGFPGSDKCQHRKWPLAHVIRGVIRGVIHQKLRLELIQHAGYLNLVIRVMLMGLRRVFMPFLMDPDKTLFLFVLYRYVVR